MWGDCDSRALCATVWAQLRRFALVRIARFAQNAVCASGRHLIVMNELCINWGKNRNALRCLRKKSDADSSRFYQLRAGIAVAKSRDSKLERTYSSVNRGVLRLSFFPNSRFTARNT